jgi:hypothetical protein
MSNAPQSLAAGIQFARILRASKNSIRKLLRFARDGRLFFYNRLRRLLRHLWRPAPPLPLEVEEAVLTLELRSDTAKAAARLPFRWRSRAAVTREAEKRLRGLALRGFRSELDT